MPHVATYTDEKRLLPLSETHSVALIHGLSFSSLLWFFFSVVIVMIYLLCGMIFDY